MIPEWCCTLYTKPKFTTTYRENTYMFKCVKNKEGIFVWQSLSKIQITCSLTPKLCSSTMSSSRSLRPCLASWVTAVFCLVSGVSNGARSCRFPFCSMYLYNVCNWMQHWRREHDAYEAEHMCCCRTDYIYRQVFAPRGHLRCWLTVKSCKTLPPLHPWSAFHSEARAQKDMLHYHSGFL